MPNFIKILRLLQNHDFQVSKFCDQVVKFVWRVWCHLVNLRFVTHSHLSPSERSHSPDTISWKNRLQTHHIGPQNVETKSSPKNLTKIFNDQKLFNETWVCTSAKRSHLFLLKTKTLTGSLSSSFNWRISFCKREASVLNCTSGGTFFWYPVLPPPLP